MCRNKGPIGVRTSGLNETLSNGKDDANVDMFSCDGCGCRFVRTLRGGREWTRNLLFACRRIVAGVGYPDGMGAFEFRGWQIGVINQAEGSSVGCSILPVLNARW